MDDVNYLYPDENGYYFFVPNRLIWKNWLVDSNEPHSFASDLERENYLDWLDDIILFEVGASYES